MKIKALNIGMVLLLTVASALQGMQFCVFYSEEMCLPSPPDELAFTYQSCCSGCEIQQMPTLDAAVSSDKFSKHHIHFITPSAEVSSLHIQPRQFYLLNSENTFSTGPPLFIIHSTFRI